MNAMDSAQDIEPKLKAGSCRVERVLDASDAPSTNAQGVVTSGTARYLFAAIIILGSVMAVMAGCSGDEGTSDDVDDIVDVGTADVGDAGVFDDVDDVADAGDEDDADQADDAGVTDDAGDVVDFDELEPHERYFEALRNAQSLLRDSSDNLPVRAQRLAEDEALTDEEKAEAIFEFVRDEIAAVPNDGPDYYDDLLVRERWGPRATLHSGIGTPREKAEVLVMLYERAGFDARVVGPWEPQEGLEKVAFDVFGSEVVHASDIELPDDYEEWSSAFRPAPEVIEENEQYSVDDFHGEETSLENRRARIEEGLAEHEARTDELVDQLRALLPEDFGAGESPVIETLSLPLVELELDGATQVLNPLVPDTAFEDDWSGEDIDEAPESEGVLPIQVTVEYATALDPDVWTPAVQGEWSADELAGRRLHLSFLNHMGFEQLATRTLREVDTFAPMLAIGDQDLSEEERQELSAYGDPFAITGEPIEHDDGDFRIGNNVLTDASASASAGDVADVEMSIDADHFPCIDTAISLRDEQGNSVEGLPGHAFEVEESGQSVEATLASNVVSPARVLFIMDISGSVPEEFRSEETVDFLVDLADSASGEYPDTEFAIVQHSRIPEPDEDVWTQSLEELEEQGLDTINSSWDRSPLWEALAEGNALDPTVIVFVNDAQANDEFTAQKEEKIRQGAPVLVIGVGPVDEEKAQTMVDLSGGELFEVQEVEEITPPLFDFLDDHLEQHYLFRLLAPLEGPTTRELTFSIPDAGVEVTEQYEVPEDPDQLECPMPIAGVRTTVRIGDDEVTRQLAGASGAEEVDYETRDFQDDVLTLLGGVVTYSFDGGKPAFGTFMDRYVTALLSGESDVDQLISAESFSVFEEPESSLFDLRPYVANPFIEDRSNEGSRTYPTGLRTSLTIERVDPRGAGFVTEFDILPLAGLETMSAPGGGEAFGPAQWLFDGELDDRWGTHDLIPNNGEPSYVDGPLGMSALEMDGEQWYFADDLIIDSEEGELHDLSVCAWVQLPEGAQGGTVIAAGSSDYFRLRVNDSGGIEFDVSTHHNRNHTAEADALEVGRWHHICGLVDSGNTRTSLYVDGERVDTEFNATWNYYGMGAGGSRIVTVGTTALTDIVGDRGHDSDTYNFEGQLADVRYFDRLLTPAQVVELASGFDATERIAGATYSTLERTAKIAVAEAMRFGSDQLNAIGEPAAVNTLDLLEDEELTLLSPSNSRDFEEIFPELSEEQWQHWQSVTTLYEDDWYVAVPEDGQPITFIAIHATTGEVIPILPDGKGGGRTATERGCEREQIIQQGIAGHNMATNYSPGADDHWATDYATHTYWIFSMLNVAVTSLEWVLEFESGDDVPDWIKNIHHHAAVSYGCTWDHQIDDDWFLYHMVEPSLLGSDVGSGTGDSCPTTFGLCAELE